MKATQRINQTPHFPLKLWRGSKVMPRSEQLTALYINHYAGPRHSQPFTCHDFWEMTFVLEGKGSVEFKDTSVELPAGSGILIPPAMHHRETTEDLKWDTLWIGLQGLMTQKLPTRRFFHLGAGRQLLPWAHSILAWRQQQVGPIGPELDGLITFMMTAFLRLSQTPPQTEHHDGLPHTLAYIHEHIDQTIVIDELAELASCSLGHFHRQFKQATHQTPLQYITRHRLELALQYLQQTQWTVKTIASKLGFADPLYFSRSFRKQFGCSPLQARNTMKREGKRSKDL